MGFFNPFSLFVFVILCVSNLDSKTLPSKNRNFTIPQGYIAGPIESYDYEFVETDSYDDWLRFLPRRILVPVNAFLLKNETSILDQVISYRLSFKEYELAEFICAETSREVKQIVKKLPLKQICDFETSYASILRQRVYYCFQNGTHTLVPGNTTLVLTNSVMFLTNRTKANCFQKAIKSDTVLGKWYELVNYINDTIEKITNFEYVKFVRNLPVKFEKLLVIFQDMSIYNCSAIIGCILTCIQFYFGFGGCSHFALLWLTVYSIWDTFNWLIGSADDIHPILYIVSMSCIVFSIIMYFVMISQLQLLSDKRQKLYEHINFNYSFKQRFFIGFGTLIFMILGNSAITFFSHLLSRIQLTSTANAIFNYRDLLNSVLYYVFFVLMVIALAVLIVYFVFLFVICSQNLMNLLGIRETHKRMSIIYFHAVLKMLFGSFVFLFFCYLLNLDENVTLCFWFVHMFLYFISIWTVFVLSSFFFSNIITHWICSLIFDLDTEQDKKNKFNFLFTFIINIHYIYYIDIIKRIILYNFLLPTFLFLLLNFNQVMVMSFGGAILALFVFCLLFIYSKEGFDQVTKTRRGLQKKCYNVTVQIGGVRPQLIHDINKGLASVYGKFISDLQKDEIILQENANKWREQLKVEIEKLNTNIAFNNADRALKGNMQNAAMRNAWFKECVQTISKQMLTRVEEILASKRELRSYEAENITNVQQMHDEVMDALRDIFNAPFDDNVFTDLAALNRFRQYFENGQLFDVEVFDLPLSQYHLNNIIHELGRPDFFEQLPAGTRQMETLFVPQVWAYDEADACLKVQKQKLEDIPNDCIFKGDYASDFEKSVRGTWIVKQIDEPIDTVHYKKLHSVGTLVAAVADLVFAWILVPLCDAFGHWKAVLVDDRVVLTDALVNLLHSNTIFEDFELKDYREMVFNQSVKSVKNLDQNFLFFIRSLTTERPKEISNQSIIDSYKTILKLRKKNKDFKNDSFKLNLVPLTDILVHINCAKLPNKIPGGYQIVSYAGIPHIVSAAFANKHAGQLGVLKKFKNQKMCIDFGGVQNHYTVGHIYNKMCENCCRLPMWGVAEYGYYTEGSSRLAIGCNITQTAVKKEIRPFSFNSEPITLPVNAIFGILRDNIVIGSANAVKLHGRIFLLTAGHNVIIREDNKFNRPKDWSEEPIQDSDTGFISNFIRDWGPIVEIKKGYWSPKEIKVESVHGQKFQCRVHQMLGELALLEFIDPVEVDYFDISGDYPLIDPDHLFLVEQNGVNHLPKYVGIYQFTEDGRKYYDYKTGAGYSGAGLLKDKTLLGIHLGGFNTGQATTWAKVYLSGIKLQYDLIDAKHCDCCGGKHCSEDCNTVFNQSSDENWDEEVITKLTQGGKRKVVFSKRGDKVVVRQFLPNVTNPIVKLYSIDEFRNKGIDETLDPRFDTEYVLWRDLNETDDIVLNSPDVVVIDNIMEAVNALESKPRRSYIELINRSKDDIRSQLHPIDSETYSKLVEGVGENNLIDLINKDLNEIQTIYNSINDSILGLKDKKNQLILLKNNILEQYSYKKKMLEHKQDMIDYLEKKKTVESLVDAMKERKQAIKEIAEEMTKKVSKEVEKFTREKKKKMAEIDAVIKKVVESSKKILTQIKDHENKIREIKKYGSSDETKKISAQLTRVNDEILQLSNKRKELNNLFQRKNAHSQELIDNLRSKIDELKTEYQDSKTKVKNLNENKNSIVKDLNEQKKEMMTKLQNDKPNLPKEEIPKLVKPKLPTTPELNAINEQLIKIKNLLKSNNLLQRVIGELIKCEKDYQKKQHLNKLMAGDDSLANQMCNHFNDVANVFGFVDDASASNFYSEEVLKTMRGVCFRLFENVAREVYQKACGHIQRNEMCDDCSVIYMKCLEDICDEFNNSFTFVFNSLSQVCVDDSNQSLHPIYVHLTPSLANSMVFKQMCFSPNQPAIVNCSRCNDAFRCDQKHCNEKTGALLDMGCTLECLQQQVNKYINHRDRCFQNKTISFSQDNFHKSVSMHCVHPAMGSVKQILVCSAHREGQTSCLRSKADQNTVPISVCNEIRHIDIKCLISILYRMAMCKGDQCDRALSDTEQIMLDGLIGNVSKINSLQIGKFFINLGTMNQNIRDKFLALAHDYQVERFRDTTNQALEESGQKIGELTDQVAKMTDVIHQMMKLMLAQQSQYQNLVHHTKNEMKELINSNHAIDYAALESTNNSALVAITSMIKQLAAQLKIPPHALEEKTVKDNGKEVKETVSSNLSPPVNQIVEETTSSELTYNVESKSVEETSESLTEEKNECNTSVEKTIEDKWLETLDILDDYFVYPKSCLTNSLQKKLDLCKLNGFLNADAVENQTSLSDIEKEQMYDCIKKKKQSNQLMKTKNSASFLEKRSHARRQRLLAKK